MATRSGSGADPADPGELLPGVPTRVRANWPFLYSVEPGVGMVRNIAAAPLAPPAAKPVQPTAQELGRRFQAKRRPAADPARKPASSPAAGADLAAALLAGWRSTTPPDAT